jgi:putative acetyltransferase
MFDLPIQMRDGRAAIIRPVRESDAQQLNDLLVAICRAGVGVVQLPDEMRKSDEEALENVRKFLPGGTNAGPRGCLFVVEMERRVVGEGSIKRMAPSRLRHIAHIGLSVHPELQGQGLGRALMQAMMDWARSVRDPKLPDITRVDLAVFADNARARRLYESFGFEVEGVRKNFIRYEDGRMTDDLIMAVML